MKRYLTVGINAYEGQELAGCVNDAYDWAEVLGARGFVGTVLTDADATLAAVTAEFRQMLVQANRGDTVVFQYSGHGTWIPDGPWGEVDGGDEPDGRDEALVPVDYPDAGLITDDDLYRLVNDNRDQGVRVLIVADSCFSGTVYRAMGGNAAPMKVSSGEPTPRVRFMPPAKVLPTEALPVAQRVAEKPANGHPRTGAALLAACRDDQAAWDASFHGRPNGAFTEAALRALTDRNPLSLKGWLSATRELIRHDQDPQAMGTWWQRNMTRFV